MSKTLSILFSSLIVILAAATININAAQARTDSEFPELSVLSQQQADYGVDVNFGEVPAISMDIIQDMIQDNAQPGSTGGPDHVVQQLQNYGGSEPENGNCNGVGNPNCTGNSNGNANGNANGNGSCNGVGNPNCTGNGNGSGNGGGNGNGNGHDNGNGSGKDNGKDNGKGNGK